MVLVTPDKYSNGGYSEFSVIKGMWLSIPKQKDLYYVGYFKNNKFSHDFLVKNNEENIELGFWNNYEIKFKSAEVPFLMIFYAKPFIKKLLIEYGRNEDGGDWGYNGYSTRGFIAVLT